MITLAVVAVVLFGVVAFSLIFLCWCHWQRLQEDRLANNRSLNEDLDSQYRGIFR